MSDTTNPNPTPDPLPIADFGVDAISERMAETFYGGVDSTKALAGATSTVYKMLQMVTRATTPVELLQLLGEAEGDPLRLTWAFTEANEDQRCRLLLAAFGYDQDQLEALTEDEFAALAARTLEPEMEPHEAVLAHHRELTERIAVLEGALRTALESGIANPLVRNRLNEVLAGEPKGAGGGAR